MALLLFFSLSVLYGLVYSLPLGLGLWPVAPDSPYPPFRALHGWGSTVEPAQLHPAASLRARSLLDGLLFAPFGAVLVYALARGRAFIRIPALMYAAASVTNMLCYFYESFAGPHPPLQAGTFWGLNLPWLLAPLALIWRMRRPDPFA